LAFAEARGIGRGVGKELKSKFGYDKSVLKDKFHELAKTLLEKEHVEEAVLVLMSSL